MDLSTGALVETVKDDPDSPTESDKQNPAKLQSRESHVSFRGPDVIRQVSQWSSKFRGEDGERAVPPAGQCYQRTGSTPTTDKPYHRQTSRQQSTRSETLSIKRADYHKDIKKDIPSGLNSTLVLAAIVVVFGSSFQFGYNIGVLNPQASLIKAFYADVLNETSEYSYSSSSSEITVLWSLTTALFIPGGLIGSLLGGWMADRFGRKNTLIISHLFVLIGAPVATACVVARSPAMLMVSRVLFGLNSGLGVCAAPMFLSEISPFGIRGAFSTIHQLFITIGILMSSIFGLPQLLGNESNWPYLFTLELIPALTALVAIPFLRETPRFLLIIKNNEAEAKEALTFYRKTNDISAEMEEMNTEQKQKSVASSSTSSTSSSSPSETFTWKQLLTTSDLKRPLLIATMLQVMQQFSGINAIFFYSAGIFKSAGVPEDDIPYAILGTNAVNVLMTVITVPLIDRVGRRPLLLVPMLIMAFDLILLTVCLKLQSSYSWLGIVSVIFIIIYVIGFAVGLGPIPMMLAAELFRQAPRPKAMSLAGIVNWTGTFIIAMIFEPLKDVTNDYTFLIFCVLLLFFVLFTFLCVPETKNLTFEEIAHKFSPGDNIEVQAVDELFSNDQAGQCAVVNFPSDSSPPPMTEKPAGGGGGGGGSGGGGGGGGGGLGASEDGVELQSFRTVDSKF